MNAQRKPSTRNTARRTQRTKIVMETAVSYRFDERTPRGFIHLLLNVEQTVRAKPEFARVTLMPPPIISHYPVRVAA